jgi:hypothetical protein
MTRSEITLGAGYVEIRGNLLRYREPDGRNDVFGGL